MLLMGKSTISMAIFNSKLLVITRGYVGQKITLLAARITMAGCSAAFGLQLHHTPVPGDGESEGERLCMVHMGNMS